MNTSFQSTAIKLHGKTNIINKNMRNKKRAAQQMRITSTVLQNI